MTSFVISNRQDAIALHLENGGSFMLPLSYVVADTRTMIGNSAVGCDQRDKVDLVRYERILGKEMVIGFDVLITGCGAAAMYDKMVRMVGDVVYEMSTNIPIGRENDVGYAEYSLYKAILEAFEKEMGEINMSVMTNTKYLAALDYQVAVTFGGYMLLLTQNGIVDLKKPHSIAFLMKHPTMFFGGGARVHTKAAWNACNRFMSNPRYEPPAPITVPSMDHGVITGALGAHITDVYVDMFKVMAFSIFDAEPEVVGPVMSYYISVGLPEPNTSMVVWGRTDGKLSW